MTELTLNQQVPNFEGVTTSQKTFQLTDLKGKNILLYFYPKDNTPGCTQEGKDFSQNFAEFQSLETEIYGISRDSIKAHENFKAKYCFPFELISDSEEEICNLFDVIKMKNMYGKQVRGIERSTFLIDKDGKLIQEWRKVKVKTHIKEVLAFIRLLPH
ncbi:MAG: peroxiredoxin [Methylococcaceae bacterium]